MTYILTYILTFYLTFYLTSILTFYLPFFLAFYLLYLRRFFGVGPAGNTLILSLLFGSCGEHCDLALAFEVRRGTF